MSLLSPITNALKKREVKKKREQTTARRKQKQAEDRLEEKREKYEPVIRKVASEFGAKVEILSRNAYVYKMFDKVERGVYIEYGMTADDIRRALRKKFTRNTTVHKVKTAIRGARQGLKEAKEMMEETGLGSGSSSMFGPVDFGYGTRTKPKKK